MKIITILTNERLRELPKSVARLKESGVELHEVSVEALKDHREARAIDVIVIGNYMGHGHILARAINEAIKEGLAPVEILSKVLVISNDRDPEIERAYKQYGFSRYGERHLVHLGIEAILSNSAQEK